MTLLEQLESSYSLLATQPGEAAAAAEGGLVVPTEDSPRMDQTDKSSSSLDSEASETGKDDAPETAEPLQPAGSATKHSMEPAEAGSGYANDSDADRRRSHSLASAQAQDVAAVGALIVQLYTRRMHYVRSTDARYWCNQIKQLPSAARSIAAACLAGVGASTDQLLQDEFFTGSVRTAAKFLIAIQAPLTMRGQGCGTRSWPQKQPEEGLSVPGASESASWALGVPCVHRVLEDLAESGGVQELHKTPGALHICLPAILQLLEAAALLRTERSVGDTNAAQSTGDGVHAASKVAGSFVTVWQQLLQCLPRPEVQRECVPLWQRMLSGRPLGGHSSSRSSGQPVSPGFQAALLQIDLLKGLISSIGLTAFLDSVHPHTLDTVCGASHAGHSARPPQSLVTHASQVPHPAPFCSRPLCLAC